MKFTLRELRFVVKSILRESICPVCGGRGAYVGLHDVECPNKNCPKFSQKQLDAGEEESVDSDSMEDYVSYDRDDMLSHFPDALKAWEDEWGQVPPEGLFYWSADEDQLIARPGDLPGVDVIKTWYGDHWR